MNLRVSRQPVKWLSLMLVISLAGGGWLVRDRWLPRATAWVEFLHPSRRGSEAEAAAEGGAPGRAVAGDSIKLSEQARRTMGLALEEISLATFNRTISVPGMIVERRGQTRMEISAPLTGVVTGVHVIKGEAVRSGKLMFRLRLTHEDLVDAQTDFLKTLGQLDVQNREVDRLNAATQSGAIAGKVLLEREYEKEKLEAVLRANREALLLHGLTERQISSIESSRNLLREMTITVPSLHDDASIHDEAAESDGRGVSQPDLELLSATRVPHEVLDAEFIVEDLAVHRGQAVQAGETLCLLVDYSQLYIEGRAFEQDARSIASAASRGWTVDAVLEDRAKDAETVTGLEIAFLSNNVDPETRAFAFYVALPNTPVRETTSPGGHRFVTWRYKPGQRLNLHVPVERWTDQIVLPADAVAFDGAEAYVFQQNGDYFQRRTVHVQYRDQHRIVIANDGSLFGGDVVAHNGAHQLQMALKNQTGGGVDPHAGHMH